MPGDSTREKIFKRKEGEASFNTILWKKDFHTERPIQVWGGPSLFSREEESQERFRSKEKKEASTEKRGGGKGRLCSNSASGREKQKKHLGDETRASSFTQRKEKEKGDMEEKTDGLVLHRKDVR